MYATDNNFRGILAERGCLGDSPTQTLRQTEFIMSTILPIPVLAAASEFWMTRWLTSFWLVGLGIVLGMAVLAIMVAFFFILSKFSFLTRWQKSGVAFWIGLVSAAILTTIASIGFKSWFFEQGKFANDEWFLFSASIFPLLGILCWGLLYGGQKRFLSELWESLSVGVGAYIATIFIMVAVGGLSCTLLVDEPLQMLQAIPKIFTSGKTSATFTVPVQSELGEKSNEFHPIPLKYDPTYIEEIIVQSKQNIILAGSKVLYPQSDKPVQIQAREDFIWRRGMNTTPPIPMYIGGSVFAQNLEIDPAEVTFTIQTVAPYKETSSIFVIAAIVIWIGLAWMLQLSSAPRLAAISMSAAKNELSQPLPWILLLIGSIFLVSFVHLPYHTEGEDIKILKECGLTLILVVCLFQGVWSASSSVSDEIEGRTALTLMSKPVHRRSFIIGKMLGIFWILLFLVAALGFVFLLSVSYKPIVDARETQHDAPLWQACHLETMRSLPGLAMVLLQATTLSTLSVALATRVPQLANFAICFTIYLIGHLTPSIVESTADAFPIVQFVAQLIAVIIPTLDWYSMDKAIDSGKAVPVVYLSGIFLYSILYTAISVFLGLLLFEDRDLA